jgi:hypothetical protein
VYLLFRVFILKYHLFSLEFTRDKNLTGTTIYNNKRTDANHGGGSNRYKKGTGVIFPFADSGV